MPVNCPEWQPWLRQVAQTHVSLAESAFCKWRGGSAHAWRTLTILARHEPCIMRPSSYARQLIVFIGVACLLLCQARPVPCETTSDSGAAAANSHSSTPCVQAPTVHDGSASIAFSKEHGAQSTPAGWRSNALYRSRAAANLHILRATYVVSRAHHDPDLVEAPARAHLWNDTCSCPSSIAVQVARCGPCSSSRRMERSLTLGPASRTSTACSVRASGPHCPRVRRLVCAHLHRRLCQASNPHFVAR